MKNVQKPSHLELRLANHATRPAALGILMEFLNLQLQFLNNTAQKMRY
jgi:hypothetical protein